MLHFVVDVCTRLIAPSNGNLSSSDFLYNSIVVVTCNDGYMFTDGTLLKVFQCQGDGQNRSTWNDTLTDCQGTSHHTAQLSCCSLSITCNFMRIDCIEVLSY